MLFHVFPQRSLFHPVEWLWNGTRDTCTSARDNCLWSEAGCCSKASFWPPKENEHCATMVTNRCRFKLISQWFQKTVSWWFLLFLNTLTRMDPFSNWQHCHKSLFFGERDTKPEIKKKKHFWKPHPYPTPTPREYWYYLGVRRITSLPKTGHRASLTPL